MEIEAELVAALRAAAHVAVLTGAGVSAESGIPTFRNKLTGLWENFDPEDLATRGAFKKDRGLVWGWYEWRRMLVLQAQPNPAHLALATLATRVPQLTLITQNVDDLHERAGSPEVIHLHGRLSEPFCLACHHPYVFPLGIPAEPSGGLRLEPPRCTRCGGYVRPGVVWFGEELPSAAWGDASTAARSCDAFLLIGTSSVVQPAASLTQMAIRRRVPTVQVNAEPTAYDVKVAWNLLGQAGVVVPALVSAVWGDTG